jgi:hypothetical protein
MSLEKWVEYGWLRREPTSPGEVKDLLGVVDRSLADSKVEAVSAQLCRMMGPRASAVKAPTPGCVIGGCAGHFSTSCSITRG